MKSSAASTTPYANRQDHIEQDSEEEAHDQNRDVPSRGDAKHAQEVGGIAHVPGDHQQ
jgi:hypothetical protein